MATLRIQDSLNILAGTTGRSNQDCINIIAGTSGRSQQDAFNIWAGTTGRSRQDAANIKAGTTGLSLQEALEQLASPANIAGLTSWFESDSGVYNDGGSTLATNGQTVQQWNNKSSSGNASQGTGAARPTYVTNAFSTGKPAIRFDGSDDFLSASLTGTSARTIFLVGKSLGGAEDFEGRLVHLNTTSVTAGIIKSSSNWAYYATEALAVQGFGVSAANYSVITMRFNSASSCDFWVNGANTGNFNPGDSYSSNGLVFGGSGAGADNANCDIGGFLNYNVALSNANRQLVERYLGAKYGITVA